MDIYNDTNTLIETKKILNEKKNQIRDVNIQMIDMISIAKQTMEGNQMELAEKVTFESINQIKNIIVTIEDTIRFLNELNDTLNDYCSCKFIEV